MAAITIERESIRASERDGDLGRMVETWMRDEVLGCADVTELVHRAATWFERPSLADDESEAWALAARLVAEAELEGLL